MCTITYFEDLLIGMYQDDLSLEWQELMDEFFWYWGKGGTA